MQKFLSGVAAAILPPAPPPTPRSDVSTTPADNKSCNQKQSNTRPFQVARLPSSPPGGSDAFFCRSWSSNRRPSPTNARARQERKPWQSDTAVRTSRYSASYRHHGKDAGRRFHRSLQYKVSTPFSSMTSRQSIQLSSPADKPKNVEPPPFSKSGRIASHHTERSTETREVSSNRYSSCQTNLPCKFPFPLKREDEHQYFLSHKQEKVKYKGKFCDRISSERDHRVQSNQVNFRDAIDMPNSRLIALEAEEDILLTKEYYKRKSKISEELEKQIFTPSDEDLFARVWLSPKHHFLRDELVFFAQSEKGKAKIEAIRSLYDFKHPIQREENACSHVAQVLKSSMKKPCGSSDGDYTANRSYHCKHVTIVTPRSMSVVNQTKCSSPQLELQIENTSKNFLGHIQEKKLSRIMSDSGNSDNSESIRTDLSAQSNKSSSSTNLPVQTTIIKVEQLAEADRYGELLCRTSKTNRGKSKDDMHLDLKSKTRAHNMERDQTKHFREKLSSAILRNKEMQEGRQKNSDHSETKSCISKKFREQTTNVNDTAISPKSCIRSLSQELESNQDTSKTEAATPRGNCLTNSSFRTKVHTPRDKLHSEEKMSASHSPRDKTNSEVNELFQNRLMQKIRAKKSKENVEGQNQEDEITKRILQNKAARPQSPVPLQELLSHKVIRKLRERHALDGLDVPLPEERKPKGIDSAALRPRPSTLERSTSVSAERLVAPKLEVYTQTSSLNLKKIEISVGEKDVIIHKEDAISKEHCNGQGESPTPHLQNCHRNIKSVDTCTGNRKEVQVVINECVNVRKDLHQHKEHACKEKSTYANASTQVENVCKPEVQNIPGIQKKSCISYRDAEVFPTKPLVNEKKGSTPSTDSSQSERISTEHRHHVKNNQISSYEQQRCVSPNQKEIIQEKTSYIHSTNVMRNCGTKLCQEKNENLVSAEKMTRGTSQIYDDRYGKSHRNDSVHRKSTSPEPSPREFLENACHQSRHSPRSLSYKTKRYSSAKEHSQIVHSSGYSDDESKDDSSGSSHITELLYKRSYPNHRISRRNVCSSHQEHDNKRGSQADESDVSGHGMYVNEPSGLRNDKSSKMENGYVTKYQRTSEKVSQVYVRNQDHKFRHQSDWSLMDGSNLTCPSVDRRRHHRRHSGRHKRHPGPSYDSIPEDVEPIISNNCMR